MPSQLVFLSLRCLFLSLSVQKCEARSRLKIFKIRYVIYDTTFFIRNDMNICKIRNLRHEHSALRSDMKKANPKQHKRKMMNKQIMMKAICWTFICSLIIIINGCNAEAEEECLSTPESTWAPIDDMEADLTPVRAMNRPLQACRDAPKPILIRENVKLVDFQRVRTPDSNEYFVAVNGASIGGVFQVEEIGCLGTLAYTAYDALAPDDWILEHIGALFLYSSGGLPIRNADDVETRGRRELYVLTSWQTWVWPAHEIHLRFSIENTTVVTVSDRPRAFSLEGFVPLDMCDDIIREYDGELVPSPEKHYSDAFKNHRTSETGWMRDHPLRRKIQRILRLPSIHQVENLQFLKYREGKWYKFHHDYFHNFSPSAWQQIRQWIRMRIASVIDLPEDWTGANEDERKFEKVLRVASKVFKAAVQDARGDVKILVRLSSASVFNHVMDLNARNQQKSLSKVLPAVFKVMGLLPAGGPATKERYDEIASAKNPEAAAQFASKVLADSIASELLSVVKSDISREELASVMRYPSEYPVEDLETEPLVVEVEPNRHATILPYLSDVEEGGETVLPNAKHPEAFLGEGYRYPHYPGAPECSQGLLLKPRKGSATMFYHRLPNGDVDELSLHAGCPPTKGIKYAINGFTWSAPAEFGISHYGL